MEGKDSKDAVNSILVKKDVNALRFSDKRETIFFFDKAV